MKHAFATLVLLLSSVAPVVAQTWQVTAEKVAKSIVYLEMDGPDAEPSGSCTGITIDKEVVLTAAHCYTPSMRASGIPITKVLFRDTKYDLLVLSVEKLDSEIMALASENPKVGQEVASYGYGYGLEIPLFRISHISADKVVAPEVGIGGPYLVIDAAFVGGQSGGPVFNLMGEIVMIVQMGTDRVGIGRGVEALRDKIGKYAAQK